MGQGPLALARPVCPTTTTTTKGSTVPTKRVSTVKAAPVKTTPTKAPAKSNPARELKVLKAFTVDHTLASPDLIAAITAAFDKHGKVAVTAQGDKALDRKMQQRVQSIGYRRGYNLNLASAVTDTHVVACPRDPSKAKSEVQAPATPRAPKAAAAPKASGAKKVAADVAKKIVADPKARAALDKAGVTGKVTTTRKATVKRRTDAQAAYDRTTFGQAAEVAADVEEQQKAQNAAIEKLKADARAAKEAEAAADTEPLAVPADLAAAMAANLEADQERIAQVQAGVLDVGQAIVKADLAPTDGLRVGVRGKDPVIETNYGLALGRPFKSDAVAREVLAEVEALRSEASLEA